MAHDFEHADALTKVDDNIGVPAIRIRGLNVMLIEESAPTRQIDWGVWPKVLDRHGFDHVTGQAYCRHDPGRRPRRTLGRRQV
jgi:hypothetical protein